MAEEEPKLTPAKPVNWIKNPDGVVEIYTNVANFQWSLDDVRIRLAQLVDDPASPTPGTVFKGVAVEKAAVTCSWRNAKVLRNQLTGLIEAYEKVNGEINIAPKLAVPEGAANTTPPKGPVQ